MSAVQTLGDENLRLTTDAGRRWPRLPGVDSDSPFSSRVVAVVGVQEREFPAAHPLGLASREPQSSRAGLSTPITTSRSPSAIHPCVKSDRPTGGPLCQ
jgi:hypothetical protein